MNSKQLKEKYFLEYKTFFAQHEKVVSIPLTYSLRNDHFPYYTELNIYKKLPLRCYMGVRTKKEPGLSLGTTTYFDIHGQEFKTTETTQYHNQLDLLPFGYINKKLNNSGVTVSFLIECGNHMNLTTYRHIIILIAFLLEEQTIQKNTNRQRSKLCKNNVKKVIQSIQKNVSTFTKSKTNRPKFKRVACAITDGGYPYIHFGGPESNDIRLNEFYEDLPKTASPTVDTALIYSGIPSLGTKAILPAQRNNISTKTLQTLMDRYEKKKKQPLFYKASNVSKKEESHLLTLLSNYGVTYLDSLYKLHQPMYSQQETVRYLRILDQKQLLDQLISIPDQDVRKFYHKIYSGFEDNHQHMSLCSLNPRNTGGTMFLNLGYQRWRKKFETAIERDAIQTTDNAFTYYKSREDGSSSLGLHRDQDVGQGIFSEFVHSGFVKIKEKTTYLRGYKDLQVHSFDFFIDTIKKKIFIKGKKLTSKDLPSQSFITEILPLLLKNVGKNIKNTDLPQSSYSKNKNELMSKIILPLKRCIKSNLGVDLPIQCIGKLGKYTIGLEKDTVGITIMEVI